MPTLSGNIIVDNTRTMANLGDALSYNAPGRGAGVALYYVPNGAILTNNVISNNTAAVEGGGVYATYYTPGVTLSHNLLSGNVAPTNSALYADAAVLSDNTITQNRSIDPNGTVVSVGSGTVNQNNLHGNFARYTLNYTGPNTSPVLDATSNWWGTTDPTTIQDLIYDFSDDGTRGVVNAGSPLASHNLTAPISPPTGLQVTAGIGTLVLNWAANSEADTAGYKVYYGSTSGHPYTGTGAAEGPSPIDVGNLTMFTLTNLPAGTHYVTISAYDTSRDGTDDQTDGNESWYAQEMGSPAANSQLVTTAEDTPKLITLTASDMESPSLTFQIVSGPSHGSLSAILPPICTPSGSGSNCTADVAYTPASNYNGPDSFTFTATDGTFTSNVATVNITVTASNDPPLANAGPDQIVEIPNPLGAPVTIDGSASIDPDLDPLTYEWRDVLNNVVGTTATVNLVLPLGTHVFTLTVNDGHGGTGSDSMTVLVRDTTLPVVTVTQPNGGEKLFASTPYVIKWTAVDNSGFDHFVVSYSTNAGTSYTAVPGCTNVSGNQSSCTWASPSPTTTTGRIKVTAYDLAGLSRSDSSNANYSVVTGSGSITVTQPNTAVDWGIGSTQQIKWNHNLGLTSYVKIEVSGDGGSTWSTIIESFKNNTATTGTYNWVVNAPIADRARVRVSWTGNPATSDISNVDFVISKPYVVVSSPNTTATNYGYGTSRTVTWTTNLGPVDKVRLLLSTDSGATFTELVTNLTATTKTVTFSVPTLGAPTDSARLRIEMLSSPAIGGTSPVDFRIEPAYVRVTQPNGPQHAWTPIGSSKTITWANNLGLSENVQIELSLDDGATYPIILFASTPSDGTQPVTVLAAWATPNARLRITWLKNGAVTDVSDQAFPIQ